jgi:hypothetical protein
MTNIVTYTTAATTINVRRSDDKRPKYSVAIDDGTVTAVVRCDTKREAMARAAAAQRYAAWRGR